VFSKLGQDQRRKTVLSEREDKSGKQCSQEYARDKIRERGISRGSSDISDTSLK
jgi:hypothetical protein